jgi:hypothetical protein
MGEDFLGCGLLALRRLSFSLGLAEVAIIFLTARSSRSAISLSGNSSLGLSAIICNALIRRDEVCVANNYLLDKSAKTLYRMGRTEGFEPPTSGAVASQVTPVLYPIELRPDGQDYAELLLDTSGNGSAILKPNFSIAVWETQNPFP